jgi:RND family efflux transporter MFP subunit
VSQRRDAVSKTVIRSPVDGRVGQRNAEVGMLADPGTVLFVVGDVTDLVVEIPLNERALAHVKEGQKVEVRSPVLGGAPMEATLSRISPFLAPGSFSTMAEIDLPEADPRLRPGMFVTADILYGESERATLVPLSTLWEDPTTGALQVFVAEGPTENADEPSAAPSAVKARTIQVVAHGADRAGVSGVNDGEWVVTVGQFLLADSASDQARVRETTWEQVLELQTRQQEDLLLEFLEKQQRLARTRGAEPPSADDLVQGGDTAASAGP